MATLVLTAAGSLLGPIGGAVGALLGQAIDSRILSPKGRQGPRLQDLRVQTSSYGSPIPKLFGTMRVAGTVIWSTDLIEHRSRRSGGKGRPSTTTYSYSASFAVALSARPVRAVRRIWADGNLLRGEAGDWKQETGFRLHLGNEDQAPDPFIAAAEAGEGTPAYRGVAYAVFENMALEPYGNRIPSLTFEVDADPGPVTIGSILQELSRSEVSGSGDLISGYAASGDSVARLIDELRQAFPLPLLDDGERLSDATALDSVHILAGEIAEGSSRQVPGAADAPGAVVVSYYDPARDYQIGSQVHGAGGRRTERIELAAAIDAGAARRLAETVSEQRRRQGARCSIQCGWKRLPVGPGALVRLGADQAEWRVTGRSIDRRGVRLELRSHRSASLVTRAADPGRSVGAPDRTYGPTRLALLDLPSFGDVAPASAALRIAAWGALPGWRRANLLVSLDQGASWEAIGATGEPAAAGVAEHALAPGATALVDEVNAPTIQLEHLEMLLEDADEPRLLAGANLAMVGEELVQFGRAVPLGGGRWRLSRLLRGRGGTEWATSTHAPGERFVLVEHASLAAHPMPLAAIGTEVRVMASGIGDAGPAEAAITWRAEALRPPSPVHLNALSRTDGGYDLRWVRRSRAGWTWGDLEVPLGEAEERYRVTIRRADGTERTAEVAGPHLDYSAAQAADDRSVGGFVDVLVSQAGVQGISRPAFMRINIEE